MSESGVEASRYLATIETVYRDAAESPEAGLCCLASPPQRLPGLVVPDAMLAMNYGCGSAVASEGLRQGERALYIGVGGGMEALQLAYYTRTVGGVVAVDPVGEMRSAAVRNLAAAAEVNDWFDPEMVEIIDGDALRLPAEDASFNYVAQNCLFNVLKPGELATALGETARVLKLGGRLAMSDPITPLPLPQHVVDDERLRAWCLSGCQTYEAYIDAVTSAGFGTVEVRSRRPYRALSASEHGLASDVLLESLDVVAIKCPTPNDGPCVFTGRTATYTGHDESFNDGAGHTLPRGLPQPVCDKTAGKLTTLDRTDLIVTDPTWHYGGGGCC
ncbi:MAG: arsenosugar biosynthesis arsenite methyltransferase ArsM [Planctomycetota bacterium]